MAMAQSGGGLLNWAGSHTFRAARVHRPETVAQVQAIVAGSRHVRAVREIELVTASGEALTLSRERDGERFLGAVAGLGALGLVTRLTLAIEPAFQVRQSVYLDLPVDALDAHFAAIMGSAYSVSLFT